MYIHTYVQYCWACPQTAATESSRGSSIHSLLFNYICVDIHVYVYTYIFTCKYIYHTFLYMHIHTYAQYRWACPQTAAMESIHSLSFIYICACIHICTYIHIYYTCSYMYIHTYVQYRWACPQTAAMESRRGSCTHSLSFATRAAPTKLYRTCLLMAFLEK